MRRRNEWGTIACAPLLMIGALAAVAWAERGALPRGLAVLIVVLCQNGLQMLHHEGAHGHFFRNPFWNELWTDLWCGVPFFDFVRSYRYFHFAHHRHVGDAEKDPELPFYAEQGYRFAPLDRRARAWMLLKDVSGYHWMQFTGSFARYLWKEGGGRFFGVREAFCFLFFWGVLFWLGWVFAAYWLGTQATLLFLIAKLRGYAEHAGRPGSLNTNTFSYPRLPFALKIAVWPFRGYLHREHHLRPDLPWYRLHPVPAPPQAPAPFYGG